MDLSEIQRPKIAGPIGAFLILLPIILIGPIATGGVEDKVNDAVSTKPMDDACADDSCTSLNADFASSTTTRDYYAWNITNLDAVLDNGTAPVHEKIGPFQYDITTTRTLVTHNTTAGHLTYTESNNFACSALSPVPCDVQIAQLNIPFMTQAAGATGMAVTAVMDLLKVGFTAKMLDQDLNTTQGGKMTAYNLSLGAVGYGGQMLANLGFNGWNATPQAADIRDLNAMNSTPLPDVANFSNGIDIALYGAPTSTALQLLPSLADFGNISLTSDFGPLAFIGMGDPDVSVSAVLLDLQNSTSVQRATAYGYLPYLEGQQGVPDIPELILRDWAMYAMVGQTLLDTGANTPVSNDMTRAPMRLQNLLGVDFTDVDTTSLLLGGNNTTAPTGLLAADSTGQGFGLSHFLGAEPAAAMAGYGLNVDQYTALVTWAGAWYTDAVSLNLAPLGLPGTMDASTFASTTFGSENPILIGAGLPGDMGLTPEQVGNIVYGPLGVGSQEGAVLFLYGEMLGQTPPFDPFTGQASIPAVWDVAKVMQWYDVDEAGAAMLKVFMRDAMFLGFVPNYLTTTFGVQPYMMQEGNNWLLGWHDPVSAFLASGNPADMSVGWSKLETNETYYSSGGISTGNATTITICTGKVAGCDKGEKMSEDGSTYLSWRNEEMFTATYGLLKPVSLANTTGGFLTSDGDMIDLSGYAVAEVICDGKSKVNGLTTNACTANVSAKNNLIQPKLTKTFSLLDVMQGTLPIYFGADVSLQAEEVTGLIIDGSATSTFYIDTREPTEMFRAPSSSNLTPIFEIKTSSQIADDDAKAFRSALYTNQNIIAYWTNFDVWIDWVALLFFVTGIGFLGLALISVLQGPDTPLFPAGDESDSDGEDSAPAEEEDEAETEADDATDDADKKEE